MRVTSKRVNGVVRMNILKCASDYLLRRYSVELSILTYSRTLPNLASWGRWRRAQVYIPVVNSFR